MSNTIASHGTPSGSVFGKLGEIIGTDSGKAYYKQNSDTLNDGWGIPVSPTPTPTPTPTPIPSGNVFPPFSCDEIQVTGSTKCYGNEVKLVWRLDSQSVTTCSLSWDRAATALDPVVFGGNVVAATLTSGQQSYTVKSTLPAGTYIISYMRTTNVPDTVRMQVRTSFPSRAVKKAQLFSYRSGSYTTNLKVFNAFGHYQYHIRNLTTGGSDNISQIISGSITQVLNGSGVSPCVDLLEVISYNDIFSFDPEDVVDCVAAPEPVSGYRIWMDYDANGRVSASWDNDGGGSTNISGSGIPYNRAIDGNCIVQNSLSTVYGTNLRISNCPYDADPRLQSRQIDAICNYEGKYNFYYNDPYGVTRNARSTGGTPNGKVYSIACGYLINSIEGTAIISDRIC